MKPHLELVGSTPEPSFEAPAGFRMEVVRSAQEECKRDDTWRHTRVTIAAYYLAERRGFEPGSEAADWKLAELQIDAADETYG
jgi:Protein of unknown function (DUF2934)